MALTLYGIEIEQEAISQILELSKCRAFEKQNIAIMPDCHTGVACCIGFTSTIDLNNPCIIPNVVGVDIGCGMLSVDIGEHLSFSLEEINKRIMDSIPMGFNVHHKPVIDSPLKKSYEVLCEKLRIDSERVLLALASLGGGNHFIEIGQSDKTGHYWLTVHTGSRNLGLRICKYHQDIATRLARKASSCPIDKLKELYSGVELGKAIAEFKRDKHGENKDLCYLEGINATEYLEDMKLAQKYASMNRSLILNMIAKSCRFDIQDEIESIHNYIDFSDGIIRKGAIRSYAGERMIIPFNMRDGLIFCKGKSNSKWNFSAPHGAGRVMSRRAAEANIDLEDYKASMEGVYSTCVGIETVDESPMAYKPMGVITSAIGETCTIVEQVKPILNIKACK